MAAAGLQIGQNPAFLAKGGREADASIGQCVPCRRGGRDGANGCDAERIGSAEAEAHVEYALEAPLRRNREMGRRPEMGAIHGGCHRLVEFILVDIEGISQNLGQKLARAAGGNIPLPS